MKVTLNIDLGESPAESAELFTLAQLANVACGGHAGDAASMRGCCVRLRGSKAALGAHPSYPDRERFGRAELALPIEELRPSIRGQCAALRDVAHANGLVVRHVKPHGALYHAANRDPALASLVVDVAADVFGHVAIVGPPAGALAEAARAAGLPFLREGFADRGYHADGTLIPRGEEGALVHDPERAAAQADRLARSGTIDTICVHGDTPKAVEIARAVRAALEAVR